MEGFAIFISSIYLWYCKQ